MSSELASDAKPENIDKPAASREEDVVPSPSEKIEIEEVIRDLPEQKRSQILHIFEELTLRIFQGSSGPKLDPKTAEILTASVDKDNEFKFRYLSQKEQHASEVKERSDALALLQHNDRKKMLWPVVVVVLFLIVICLGLGIYFSATGHDVLGATLITGVVTGAFAFLAGIGTANFFKK